MRINLEWGLTDKKKVYAQAKELIEKQGIDDYVLEMRQMTPMGGIRYVVTSKDELDKEYIGYRGFVDYEGVIESLEQMKNPVKSTFDTQEYLAKMRKRDKNK